MRTSRILLTLLLVFCTVAGLAAESSASRFDFGVSAAGNAADTVPYDMVGVNLFDEIGFAASYEAANILIHLDGGLRNDGAYTPEESYLLGHYIELKNAFIDLHTDRFGLTFGRRAHQDIVESPYSLFISSVPLPALVADARYEDDRFFYESRWVQLNALSPLYVFPGTTLRLDRGMNYKAYGLKLGNVRFGLQDSIVFTGRSFDAEFFLNPMFQYLQQLVRSTDGKPWTEKSNCNSLNGFFADVRSETWYAYAQVLIDDINLDFLGFWGKLKMPTKIAWSLGGRVDLPWGTLGAYTAGATKYTFEATYATSSYSDFPYEYAYYPASQYELADGTPMTLDYTQNYIGYKYGENALSLLVDYRRDFAPVPVVLAASIEYVISGSKSPSNPWHEAGTWLDLDWLHHSPLYFLEDPQLEHTLRGTVSSALRLGGFEVSASVMLGGRWNSLTLVEVAAGEPKVFRPEGLDRLLYAVRLGVSWHLAR
jgi:hypothetical protein